MVIVNTPHNPVGKVFTRGELEKIADLAKEFNLMVMSDEVVSCTSRIRAVENRTGSEGGPDYRQFASECIYTAAASHLSVSSRSYEYHGYNEDET